MGKMQLIKNVCLLTMGICFIACSHSKKEDVGIRIHLNENVSKEIPFSSFVDSITYIPLETNDDCLIGKIQDIILSDSIIFVLKKERNEILLFDKQGKYIRKIAHIGNGPGEYTVINQMAYNEKRHSLSVASSKIIEYDLYGNLKNEFATPFYVADLHLFDNGDYLLSRLERLDEPNSAVILTDSKGHIKKEIMKRNSNYNVETSNCWELICFDEGIHFISPQIENTLYSFREYSLIPDMKLNILPEIPSDFYKSNKGVPLLGDNYYRTIYRESKKWVNLIFCTLKEVRTLLYNKETNQSIVGEVFKNDMDEKEQLFFLSASENNTFTNYVKSDNEDGNPVIQILHLK